MEKNTIEHKVSMSIEAEPYAEMMAYAHKFSPDECSGVGLVERIDYTDNSIEFKITKVFLPNQYNTCTTTDIPDEELNRLNTELVMAGEETHKLKFHWHSHVDMDVFHSSTDDDNYDELKLGEYAVSLVVNKKGAMLGSVHLYEPLRISVCNIEVEIEEQEINLDTAKIDANVARVKENELALRKEHSTVYPAYSYGYGQDSWQDDYIMEGLAMDRDFEQLLVQGEKAGLITLYYDETYTIYGYMNNRTTETFLLGSENQSWKSDIKFKGAKQTGDRGYIYDD